MAFLCPLLYAQTTLSGLLNGLGKQFFLFWNSILSSAISIAVIWFFMPLYGIPAFLFGWFLSLLFSVCNALIQLWKRTKTLPSFYNCFLKPSLAGAAAGLLVAVSVHVMHALLRARLEHLTADLDAATSDIIGRFGGAGK
jgi:stage V sporulation protein B